MKLAPAEDFNKRQSSASLWTGRGVLMKGLIKLFVWGWRVALRHCRCSLWWVMYCLDSKIERRRKRKMEKWDLTLNYCQYIIPGLKLDFAFSFVTFRPVLPGLTFNLHSSFNWIRPLAIEFSHCSWSQPELNSRDVSCVPSGVAKECQQGRRTGKERWQSGRAVSFLAVPDAVPSRRPISSAGAPAPHWSDVWEPILFYWFQGYQWYDPIICFNCSL